MTKQEALKIKWGSHNLINSNIFFALKKCFELLMTKTKRDNLSFMVNMIKTLIANLRYENTSIVPSQ